MESAVAATFTLGSATGALPGEGDGAEPVTPRRCPRALPSSPARSAGRPGAADALPRPRGSRPGAYGKSLAPRRSRARTAPVRAKERPAMGRSALAQRLPRAVLGALGEAYPPLLDGFTSFAEEDAAGGGGAASCGEVPPRRSSAAACGSSLRAANCRHRFQFPRVPSAMALNLPSGLSSRVN